MTDDDLARALRALDPARTPADAPLPLVAERRLREILAGSPASSRGSRRGRSRRATVSLIAAAVAVVAVVTSAVLWWPAPTATALTPEPLAYTAVADDAPALIDAAQDRLERNPGRDDPLRRSVTLGWFFSGSPGDASATVFRREWVDVRWDDDLAGSVVTTAAESTNAEGDTVVTEGPTPGTVVGSLSFVRGQFDPLSDDPPEADVDDMRQIAATAINPETPLSAGDVILGAQRLLGEWTLSDAQQSALIELIETTPDVRVLGQTADRLGRPAIGLGGVPTGSPETDTAILISLETGRILGVESTLRTAVESLGLPAGSVTSYTLWDVEDRKDAAG